MAEASRSKTVLRSMLREVHEDIPASVTRTGKKGKARRAMLTAIAFSKARAAGARLPKK